MSITRLERRLTVLLVDDHELVRLGLRMLLEAQRSMSVVGEASTAADGIARAVEEKPTLVVTEHTLPDGSGIDVCRQVLARVPGTRVVIVSEHVDEASISAGLQAGASGFLSKRARGQDLGRALHSVAAAQSRLRVPPMQPLIGRLRADGRAARDLLALTAQERRVLALVAGGKTNREIGTMLGLSEKTVKNYLSHAFQKLSVSRRAQAAVLFIKEYGVPLAASTSGNRMTARSA